LVNNVLDFSGLEEGKREFSIESHNLDALISKALDTQRFALEKGAFEVDWQGSPKPLIVRTDPDATERILLNLIDNALKYAADSKALAFQAIADDAEMITVRVSDRGPGIPPNQREKIFSRFHRLDDQLMSQSGAGLGLSIAQMIAKGMHGSLLCVAEPGHTGGTLELKLPRAHV
jgi:two-component system phosphate regulon sensor histidine kinase PhoR